MVAAIASAAQPAASPEPTDCPERWARALDHALHAGVETYTTPTGERFASSGSHLDLIFRVTAETCECAAAKSGHPVSRCTRWNRTAARRVTRAKRASSHHLKTRYSAARRGCCDSRRAAAIASSTSAAYA